MLETAVRANELWGLFKEDIPSQGSKLMISRQYLGSDKYGSPKGKVSRYVPFSPRLRSEIDDWLKLFNNDSKTLFSTSTETPIDHDNFVKRVFQKDMKESKVRQIRFHDLRHTAITRFLRLRVRVEVVQKIAGHKDLKTTQRYVHILGMDIEDVGNDLNFSISSSRSNKVPLKLV